MESRTLKKEAIYGSDPSRRVCTLAPRRYSSALGLRPGTATTFTIGIRDACDPGTFSSPISAGGPGTCKPGAHLCPTQFLAAQSGSPQSESLLSEATLKGDISNGVLRG